MICKITFPTGFFKVYFWNVNYVEILICNIGAHMQCNCTYVAPRCNYRNFRGLLASAAVISQKMSGSISDYCNNNNNNNNNITQNSLFFHVSFRVFFQWKFACNVTYCWWKQSVEDISMCGKGAQISAKSCFFPGRYDSWRIIIDLLNLRPSCTPIIGEKWCPWSS